MGEPHDAATRLFSGTRRVDAIRADDRALIYGDGLFETMHAHRGSLPWWEMHWARLERGARCLQIPTPEATQVRVQAERLLDGADGVLKLLLSRGSGGRGYAPPPHPQPNWMLSLHPLPPPAPTAGLTLRWCDTRLSIQPALAGIKHCNRLEQVLARGEWQGIDVAHEGLMRSMDGDVVCATAANLFVLHGDCWRTPEVDRCGVAGVCRQWLLERFPIRQARLLPVDIETADAIVLTNAVRGILPVTRLGERGWQPHPMVAQWQDRLAAEHPAFAKPTGTEVS